MEESDGKSLGKLLDHRILPGVVIANEKGIIQSVNLAACLLFEYAKEEMVGHSINMIMSQAVAIQHDEILRRYFLRGSRFKTSSPRTLAAVCKGGREIHVTVSLSLMVMSDSVCFIAALIDEVKEQSFSVTTDESGKILSVAGNCWETCGYFSSQLLGENISALYTSSVVNEHASFKSFYVPGGESRIRELRHYLGHLIPVSLQVQQASAIPVVFNATIAAFKGNLEAKVIVSPNGLVLSFSPECLTMFGYEKEELIDVPIANLCPNLSLRARGKQVCLCKHKDGSHFFVSSDVQPFASVGAEFFRVVLTRSAPKTKSKKPVAPKPVPAGEALEWYDMSTKVLGAGLFGEVRAATHRLTGLEVAVKTLKKQQFISCGMPFPPREVDLLNKLRHPSLLHFFHSVSTEEVVYIITELVTGGDLYDYVAQREKLPEEECQELMKQVVFAVAYMHHVGICHRDLKLENILLDTCGRIKIIDFGLGNFFTSGKKLSTFCGSPDYASPELWSSSSYVGPGVDVWSIGVIVYILSTGYVPFRNSTEVVNINYLWPQDVELSAALKDFVAKIFRPAHTRYSLNRLIGHPWIGGGSFEHEKETTLALNDFILERMELELGFRQCDIIQAVMSNEHNQLSTTYALLEFHLDDLQHNSKMSSTQSH